MMRTHWVLAVNNIEFKWSFVMDKKESPQNYFNPLPPEKISLLDLEKDIELSSVYPQPLPVSW